MTISTESFENKLLDLLTNRSGSSHSFIFSGAKGTQKKETTKQLVCKLLKTNELNANTNLLWIDSEEKNINVDEIRNISSFMYRTSYHAELPKLIVITCLDSLNIHSLNALLKLLEEPTKNTYFILLSHNIEALPDTIKSRCIIINFPPANLEDTRQILKRKLKGTSDSELDEYLSLSQNAGVVVELFNNNALEIYNELLKLLQMKSNASTDLYKFIEKNFSTLEQVEIFRILIKNFLHSYIKTNKKNLHKLFSVDQEINSLLFNAKTFGLDVKSVVLIIICKVSSLTK
jgi:DNA polymerase III delta prime subunit